MPNNIHLLRRWLLATQSSNSSLFFLVPITASYGILKLQRKASSMLHSDRAASVPVHSLETCQTGLLVDGSCFVRVPFIQSRDVGSSLMLLASKERPAVRGAKIGDQLRKFGTQIAPHGCQPRLGRVENATGKQSYMQGARRLGLNIAYLCHRQLSFPASDKHAASASRLPNIRSSACLCPCRVVSRLNDIDANIPSGSVVVS
jgi:hypothetical protein